jgi:hypothetical protein
MLTKAARALAARRKAPASQSLLRFRKSAGKPAHSIRFAILRDLANRLEGADIETGLDLIPGEGGLDI